MRVGQAGLEYFKYVYEKANVRVNGKPITSEKEKEKPKGAFSYEQVKIEYMKVTYSALLEKPESKNQPIENWKLMKLESSSIFEQFKAWLKDLVQKQKNISEDVRAQLKKELEPGGYWSPEAVSDRIIQFAKSISGGDKSKLDLLLNAVKKAFDEVKEMFGGKLPDITQRTYELTMEKFEEWRKEGIVGNEEKVEEGPPKKESQVKWGLLKK